MFSKLKRQKVLMKIQEILLKFELYIVSLWLLFFLIIVVTADFPTCFGKECVFIGWNKLISQNAISIVSLLFLILGIVFYYRFEYRISGSTKLPVKITKIEDCNYEHLTFLATYIIPLISFNLTNIRYAITLAVLLFVIGIIYIKTDKFYVNPNLAVLGFRLYKVAVTTRTATKENIIVITKNRLSESDQIRIFNLDERVCYGRIVK